MTLALPEKQREPGVRLSVGWRSDVYAEHFISAKFAESQIVALTASKAPARRDGQTLARRLRLDSGRMGQAPVRAFI